MTATQTQNNQNESKKAKNKRSLLLKKPFYRISANVGRKEELDRMMIGEMPPIPDSLRYDYVTQADFLRELDPNAHAINDPNIYQNWVEQDDGKFYETQWERHAFAFQQEILSDRLVRLTGNDIQFDLSERTENDQTRQIFYKFKSVWAEKSMERAWYGLAKSVLSTGDGAFVGILKDSKFSWKVLSYEKGDELYPHYDRYTGKLSVFARKYSDYDDEGNTRNYVDAWDEKYYYRLVESSPSDAGKSTNDEEKPIETIGDFKVEGYELEQKTPHGFDRIPVSYMRKDEGPCWSNSQDSIEKYELAFSRLAQSNSAFGLPILTFTNGSNGKSIQELTMGDMSYAAKIFLIPKEGKAEFMQRQDASTAYKAQLDELKRKIYEMSHVVKAPELKSGDTPAAAIKLLYSDSYNKGMNETQEFDEAIDDIVYIFSFGAGVEKECRLDFINLPLSHWIIVFLPISEGELTTVLATGVQNGFCSKQTASEKFPYAVPQEWSRLKSEKHDEQMNELSLQEQKIEIQNEANVEMQKELADIEVEKNEAEAANTTTQGQEGAKAQNSKKTNAPKAVIKKGSGSSGNGKRGRPNMSGAQWDENRNKINPLTGRAYSKWGDNNK